MSVIALLSAVLALAAGATVFSLDTPAASTARSVAVVAPATPAAPGQEVRLAARLPDVIPASVTWDLDGDGRFDDAAGPVVTARFGAPGRHPVAVRVTWLADPVPLERTATTQVAVSR